MWPSKEEEQHMQQTHQTPGPLTTPKAFRRLKKILPLPSEILLMREA